MVRIILNILLILVNTGFPGIYRNDERRHGQRLCSTLLELLEGMIVLAFINAIVVFDDLYLLLGLKAVSTTRFNHHALAGFQEELRSFARVQVHQIDPDPPGNDIKILGFVQMVVTTSKKLAAGMEREIPEVADGHAIFDEREFSAFLDQPSLLDKLVSNGQSRNMDFIGHVSFTVLPINRRRPFSRFSSRPLPSWKRAAYRSKLCDRVS